MFIKKYILKLVPVFLFLIFALILVFGNDNQYDKYLLSDMGGVYSSEYKGISFFNELYLQALVYKSDLKRWGLKRNGFGNAPDANPGEPGLIKKYNGIYIGDSSVKKLYLTFDEGYENGYTSMILDTLRDNNVKAVFFITGPYLKEEQALVRRMVEEGHIVGNHTVNHPSLPSLDDENIEKELLGLERAFEEKFNRQMSYLRPPMGEYNENVLKIADELEYTTLFWSFAYDDWYKDKKRGADYAFNKVMDNLHNGAVILLHAVSQDNALALDRIIKEARELGYEFGDIREVVP